MANNFPTELRAGDFHKQHLSSAFKTGRRVLTPENASRQEPFIWQEIQKDASIFHYISFSRKLTIGKGWHIEPFDSQKENRQKATAVKNILMKTRNFWRFMYAASEFFIRGESYGYPNYARDSFDALGTGKRVEWWYPTEVKQIDRYRIRKIVEDGFSMRREIASLSKNDWVPLDKDQNDALMYFNNSGEENRFTYGHGLIEPLYWTWYAKKIIEAERLNASERYGQGLTVVKIKGLKFGSPDRDLETYKSEILSLMEFLKSKHAACIDSEETIEVIDPSGTGMEILDRGVDYYDNQAMILLLGANLSIQGGTTGSYNQATIHQETTFHNAHYNRTIMEEEVTRSLIEGICRLNQPQFEAIGLGEAQNPRFKLELNKDEDPTKAAELLRIARNDLGLTLVKEEAYRMLNLTMPTEEEDEQIIRPPLENIGHPVDPTKSIEEQDIVLSQGARYIEKDEKKDADVVVEEEKKTEPEQGDLFKNRLEKINGNGAETN